MDTLGINEKFQLQIKHIFTANHELKVIYIERERLLV